MVAGVPNHACGENPHPVVVTKFILNAKEVEFDGVECYQLELVTRWGDHQVGLFEVESGLHRKVSTRTAPGSDTFSSETTYSDYRRVKGVKRPFALEISAMGMKQVIRFDSIELGVKFDKDAFDPPKN